MNKNMTSTRSSELLGVENREEEDEEEYMKQFLIKPKEELETSEGPVMRVIIPQPGFCVKLKTSEGKKVFINICQADNLPAPREITDEELLRLLDSDDPSGYRIPMSLGEPHEEKDNSGMECRAYDVVISPEFLKTLEKRELMKSFFLTVTIEGLEDKYSVTLDRKWSILKNRKFLGFIPEQHVRTKSKPLIMDLGDYKDNSKSSSNSSSGASSSNEDGGASSSNRDGGASSSSSTSGASSSSSGANSTAQAAVLKKKEAEKNKKIPEPVYELVREPEEGYPEYIVAEIHLPLIKEAASFTLDVGEERLLLETRAQIYRLDTRLPYKLIAEEVVSQFNRKTRILTVTMPVRPLSEEQLEQQKQQKEFEQQLKQLDQLTEQQLMLEQQQQKLTQLTEQMKFEQQLKKHHT